MKSFVALSLAAAAMAIPQGSAPAGCSPSASGTFQITTVNATTPKKRDLESRQLAGPLTLTLQGGILKDQAGRTGYIASNNQFQFDSPIQAGALITSGFSLCSNQSLALGGSAIWYQCLSGNFYNLYNRNIRPQDCLTINIQAVNGGTAATQLSDGQPQATSKPAVTQISDGQPQASKPVVTQISDGQPQASKPAVVTQISDGQPQATRPGVVTQISDGQPQATRPASRPVVTQISDGQPQASAPASRPVVTQISDGQPQASAPASRPVVSQISDGQPQASAPAPAPLPTFTGAATAGNANHGALFAGLMGLLALL